MRIIMIAGLMLLFSPRPGLTEPAPISPTTYRDFTCAQLAHEGHVVSRKGFLLSGLQPGTGGTDTTEVKSAVIIVWPAAKNLSADKLSDLKYAASQIDALEEASVASQCSIQFQRPAQKQG
jgi:hypothetical protein